MTRAKELLRDCWPFLLSGFAITIYMKIDMVMLGEMTGSREAGVYAVALRLSEPWYLIPVAIVGSAFPNLLKARQNQQAYAVQLGKVFRALAATAYAIAIPITLLSEVLIDLLFGGSYAGAGPVLAVHIWACHAVFLGVAYNSWVTAENLGVHTLVATAAGAALNIALNWVLIPLAGALGAAIATVIAYWFVVFVVPLASSRTRSMSVLLLRALVLLPLKRARF
jgi:polysaccharide transporter, PST family